MPGRRSTLRLGRLAGVPIGVQPLWLVIVGLITYALGHDYFPTEAPGLSRGASYALGLLSALLLFAGILLHELGHAVVARRRGVEVDEIDLWLLGGVSRIHGEPERPEDELRFALAGPAVTAVILAVTALLRLAAGTAVPDWVRALLDYQISINALILVFNLLPAFPLDGGRVTRSLLWLRLGDRTRATDIAAAVGRAFGFVMVALGLLAFASGVASGLWLALIGGFLVMAGAAEAQQLHVQHALGDVTAGELMSTPALSVPATATLDEAAARFVAHLVSALALVDADGRATGVLGIDAVRTVPAPRRSTVLAGQVAAVEPELLVDPRTPVSALLGIPAFHRAGCAVVVGTDGRPLGVVSVTDVRRRLRADALDPGQVPQPRAPHHVA